MPSLGCNWLEGHATMELLNDVDIVRLSNPGVVSEQLLSPHNSASTRVTITRVTVQVGASQPRHSHEGSEQIWIAISGSGNVWLSNIGAETHARTGSGDIELNAIRGPARAS